MPERRFSAGSKQLRPIFLVASLAILFSHTMAAAAPKPPALMTPTGPWNVDFADKMCLLSRPYGKDSATQLMLKPAMLGDSLEIIVTRATSDPRDARSGKTTLSIAGTPSEAETYFTAYSTAKARLLRVWIKEDAIALSAVRGTLQIDAKPEGRYLFAIPGIEHALPILSNCLDQLRAAYKISKTDLTAIVTEPKAELAAIFSTEDYPYEAYSRGKGGTVGVLFWIEATGRVSNCEVIESSAAPVLEKTTCDVLTKRAKYNPAKDATGRAVRAPSFSRVRWMPSF
jgi:TonB family protein